MAHTMYNEASAPYGDLAEIDALDWAIFLDVVAGNWVRTGCLVSPQGTPDGTVSVSAGTYRLTTSDKTCAGGTVSVLSGSANPDGSTSMAPHATLPRYDLIILNSSNQLGVIHGATVTKTFANDFREKAVYPNWNHTTQLVIGVIYVIPLDQTDAAKISPSPSAGSKIIPKDVHGSGDAFHDEGHVLNSTTKHVGAISDTQHGIRTLASAHALQDLSGAIASGQGLGAPLALTGAVAATRYAGGHATGAPTTGTFAVGDFVVTATGKMYVCTAAGTPGTWGQVGGAGLAVDPLFDSLGDLVVGTGPDASAKLAAPTQRKQVLGADASGNVAWQPMQSGPKGVRLSDEMLYSSSVALAATGTFVGYAALQLAGSSSGLTVQNGEVSHPGVMSLDTGSTTTGRAGLATRLAGILLGSGRSRFGAWVKADAALSDATNSYSYVVGFADDLTGSVVDGAWFSYAHGTNSGKWQAQTSSNSTPTAVDTGITVVVSTWYYLEVEVNAAGTSVDFYIDKVLTNTVTTNIPTGAGRETGVVLNIRKAAGTTARSLYVDAHYLELDLTTAR